MYFFIAVSSIYICFLFSFIPQIFRESQIPSKTLKQLSQEYQEDIEIENEFEFLDNDEIERKID